MNERLTPTSWRWKDVPSAGIQIYAKVPFEANCGEFITKKGFDQPVFQLWSKEPSNITRADESFKEMMLSSAQWIQFEPNNWHEMQKQNAELLVTCANSCLKVNSDNPQVVAENIETLYKLSDELYNAYLSDKPMSDLWHKLHMLLNKISEAQK